MISKNFLSGIFSIVSFILVSNLVIPSTFAACTPDVSGKWVVVGVDITECCSDKGGNFKDNFVVTQVGDEISASWISHGDSAVLTGIVNGNSVYFKITGSGTNCTWIAHVVGIIKGTKTITCYFTHAENEPCNCKSHGSWKVKIVKKS